MDPEDRHLGGKYFFCVQTPLFTCAFHGPPSGIQVSLTHSPVLATDGALKLAILQRNVGQKWLGYMLAAEGSQSQHIDLEYHLQQASKSSTQTNGVYWTEAFPFPND